MKKLNELQSFLTRLRGLMLTLIILCSIGIGNAWGTTIASWGRISIAANTDYKASDGDANNKNVAKFSSNKAMNSGNGTYCYYGSAAGGAVITFSNLNLSGYTGITMTFYTRASKQGNMKIQYTTNGSTWTDLDNPGPSITKSEAQKTSSTIPNTATGIKLTHSASSGSLYFGTIVISGTAAASCGVPTSPSNGAKTATTQYVSWTAPSPAPASGYLVAIGATTTPPGDNVQVNSSQTWGDYYVNVVSAGTTSLTFTNSNGAWYAGTEYHWWVRSKCGASNYSSWVAGTAFTIPNIAVSTDEIDGMDYEYGSGPSSPAKTFTVSGTGLTGNLTVALDGGSSSDFEISKTSATTGYGYTLSLTQSSGSVGTTTIWVRLKSGKSVDTYVDNITISGGTATAQEVVIGGKVTAAKVATPTFSPAAGTYTGAQNVTISCETAGATIYYTTNGSTPTTSSSVYSSPISVTQGTTIKAFATKAGMPNSDVATAAYVIRYTVSWSVNGTAYSSPVVVTCGSTTSTPADPSVQGECTGSTFMGWTSNSSWASDSAPGDLFNGTSPTITGNITFYAVFADEN